jgi:hypothetical protein
MFGSEATGSICIELSTQTEPRSISFFRQTANSENLVIDDPHSSPTPEPTSLFLFGSGLLTVGGALLRRLKLQGRS